MAFAVASDYFQTTNRNINGQHHHHVTSTTVAVAVATSATTSPTDTSGKLPSHLAELVPASVISKVQSSSPHTRHKNNQVMMSSLQLASTAIPPIAHAISGSIGSTISTLLLYPLERSRIEMQMQASLQNDFEKKRNDTEIVQDLLEEASHPSNPHHEIFHNDGSVQDSINGSDGNSTGCFSYNIIDNIDKSLSSSMALSSRSSSPCSTLSLPNSPTASKKNNANHPSWLLPNLLFQKSCLIRTIYNLHLQKSLYKGCKPMAVTIALSNFIFFYTLQTLKKLMRQNSVSLLTSSIAGVINVLLTNPLWVANLRLVQEPPSLPVCDDVQEDDQSIGSSVPSKQQTRYRGMVHCLKEICRKEGIRQLWAGTGASLLLVSNPAIQYYIYENCKMSLLEKDAHRLIPRHSLRPLEAFLVGALAKGLATIATYPLQLAQVLLRLQTNNRENESDEYKHGSDRPKEMAKTNHSKTRYSSLLDCMFTLYKGGGIKALYSGINAKLIQTVLSSALTFLTYEQILNLVAKSYWWVVSKRLVQNGSANG